MTNVAPHAAVADSDGAAVDGQASEMESVKREDSKQACADREESNQEADPEILAKGEARWQAILAVLAAFDARHDERGERRDDEERPF